MAQRHERTEEDLEIICDIPPGKAGDPGRTAGQKAASPSAIKRLEGQPAKGVVAHKGYDTVSIRALIRS